MIYSIFLQNYALHIFKNVYLQKIKQLAKN